MRIRNRSLVTSGMALASAAAIVAATPTIVSGAGSAIGGTGTDLRVSADNVELTALADITVKGIVDAYWSGWGGYIGPVNGKPDKYYPNINATGTSPVYVSGASGVAYYVIDEALDQFGSVNLDNYFFETGAYFGTGKATAGSAAGALIYVGSSELFGDKSPIAQLAKAVFYYGITPLTQSTILQLATLVPTATIGPVKVGGGILASLYFTGQTPDGQYSFGSAGLPAVLGYVTTSISDALPKPGAAVVPGAATKQLTAASTDDTVANAVEAPAHASAPTPAPAPSSAPAADSKPEQTSATAVTDPAPVAKAAPKPTASAGRKDAPTTPDNPTSPTGAGTKRGTGGFKASPHSTAAAASDGAESKSGSDTHAAAASDGGESKSGSDTHASGG